MCAFEHAATHTCVGCSVALHLLFWNRGSFWFQSLYFHLSWLASKPRASCCLYLLFSRIELQTHTTNTWLLSGCRGFTFVSSSLHNKRFICWAVSPSPQPTFTCYWSSRNYNKNVFSVLLHVQDYISATGPWRDTMLIKSPPPAFLSPHPSKPHSSAISRVA